MNAWLLTWEGTVGPALDPNRKLVAILSARTAIRVIQDLVDLIYCRNACSAEAMSKLANKRRQRSKSYKHLSSTPSRLLYGHNPCIFARIVAELKVTVSPDMEGECVQWIDPPYLVIPEPGALPIEKEPACPKRIIRRRGPLGTDLC